MASEPAAPVGADTSTGPADGAASQPTPASPDLDSSGVGEASSTGVTPAPAKYRFAGREWDSQKHAEDAWKANLGRNWEPRLRAAEQRAAQIEAENQALRGALTQGRAPGQGPGRQAPVDPQTLPELLNKNNGFQLYQQLAEDPNIGVAGALYALAEDLGKQYEGRFGTIEQRVEERFAAAESRTQFEQAVARTLTAGQKLAAEFPELDDSNQSEEAQEAQQEILAIIQDTPLVMATNGQQVPMGSVWLATNPEQAIRWAVGMYRSQHGRPVFAHPPGTSGSPSSTAARAAELAAAAGASAPLDGTGVPRPRPGGQPLTLEDRWRTEKPRPEARTPSGRRLGFPEPA